MTLSTVLSGAFGNCSLNTDIELLAQKDILASITGASNVLNMAATSLVIENEKGHRRFQIVCYPAVTVKTAKAVGHMASNYELNMIALSRLGEREQYPRGDYVASTFQTVALSILPVTLFLGEYVKWLGIIALAMVTFLIQASLFGVPFGMAIPALLRYGGLIGALGIGLATIRFIFQQARIPGLASLQKALLYTAGFLLTYELWILFSVVYSHVR